VRKATDGALSFGYRFDGKNKPNFLSKFIVHYGAKKSLIVKKNKKGRGKFVICRFVSYSLAVC
jgi:hypothetical protein